MKKILLIVVILLLLGGAGYYLFAKSASKMTPGNQEQSGGVFGSIKDALSKSLSLQCTFTGDDGVPTTAYIKAGAVRVDTNGKTSEQQASFIMKDKKLYFWQTNSKQGTMMTFSDETVTGKPGQAVPTSAQSGSANDKGGNVLGELEKFKDKCKAAVVSDSLFTPPSDVKFTDFSKMIPSGVPSGVPTGMSQQDVQKLMQQYQQPADTSGN